MALVGNSRQLPTRWRVEDTNKGKKDVTHVRYSSNGRVCGVLVAEDCLEQNQEQHVQNDEKHYEIGLEKKFELIILVTKITQISSSQNNSMEFNMLRLDSTICHKI